MPTTIDAHHHLWDLAAPFDYGWLDTPNLASIRRNFLPDDLGPLLRESGIDGTIVVQTQHDLAENDWALALADRYQFIAGVVGWVDLASPDCERQVREARTQPKFVGVRHVTQDEPDDDFIVSAPILRGLRVLEREGVPFDLLFFVKHLHHVPALVAQVPDLPLVLDHLAKPRVRHRALDDWRPAFRDAARCPNVYCKLSGLVTEADWSHWRADDLKPYVREALDAFGPDRLMFGSDWPVSNLAATYAEVVAALDDALGPISPAERAAIFGGTASRFYGLVV